MHARCIAFPGNDRPGIMLAGVVGAGQEVTLFANNHRVRQVARDLIAAGVKVVGIVDSRPDAPDERGFPVYKGAHVV